MVQFDQAPPAALGIRPLVVVGEALLQRGTGNTDEQQAEELFRVGNFRQENLLPTGWDCPELESRLLRFVAPPGDDSSLLNVTDSLKRVRDQNFSAGHVGVAACQGAAHPDTGGHQHPGGDVVVKQSEGPIPTSVANPTAAPGEGRSDVLVAVIDTGIAQLQHGDGWLAQVPRFVGSVDPLDAFPASPSPPAPGSPPLASGNGYLDFAAGHGTFVAGLIQSVEPEARIRAYAALDSDGFGSELAVACAMIQAYKDGARIINMSLGVRTVDGTPPFAIQAALDAIAALSAGGDPPVFVAAAGNFGDDVRVYPAASAGVISVAALDADGDPAAWSSRGDWVRFSTVGEGVVAPYVAGIREPDFGGATFPFPGWAMWTGTSFAAPQIAGALARICRTDGVTASEAVTRLAGTAAADPEFGVELRLLPGTRTTV